MFDASDADQPSDYPPETEAERLARQAAVLRELTEITLAAARALGRQVADEAARESAAGSPVEGSEGAAAPGPSRSAALGAALAQVARAVRQSVALEARLHQDQEAHGFRWTVQRAAQAREAQSAREAQAQRAGWARDDVRSRAKRIIRTEAPLSERERLYDILNERLDDLPGGAGWLAQSTEQWIAKLRRELGLGDVAPRKRSVVTQAVVVAAEPETPVEAQAGPGDDPSRPARWPQRRSPPPDRSWPGGDGVIEERSG